MKSRKMRKDWGRYQKIYTELRVPVSTIGVIIRRWKICGSTHDNQRTGREHKISPRTKMDFSKSAAKLIHGPYRNSERLTASRDFIKQRHNQ